MAASHPITLEEVEAVAARLAAACRSAGREEPAAILSEASSSAADHERLLDLRSALIRTRPEWSILGDAGLVEEAERAVAAAKRLAIDL